MGAEEPGGRGGLRTDTQHHVRGCQQPRPGEQVGPAPGACGTDPPATGPRVPQGLLQPGVLLLLLQQPPLDGTQLLLGLALDVVGHHHRCLQVSLEAPPLLRLVLEEPQSVPASDWPPSWAAGPQVGPRARSAVAASPPGKGPGGAAPSGVGVPVLKSRSPELPSRPRRSWFQGPGPANLLYTAGQRVVRVPLRGVQT